MQRLLCKAKRIYCRKEVRQLALLRQEQYTARFGALPTDASPCLSHPLFSPSSVFTLSSMTCCCFSLLSFDLLLNSLKCNPDESTWSLRGVFYTSCLWNGFWHVLNIPTHLRDLTMAGTDLVDLLQVWTGRKVQDRDALRHRSEGEDIYVCCVLDLVCWASLLPARALRLNTVWNQNRTKDLLLPMIAKRFLKVINSVERLTVHQSNHLRMVSQQSQITVIPRVLGQPAKLQNPRAKCWHAVCQNSGGPFRL